MQRIVNQLILFLLRLTNKNDHPILFDFLTNHPDIKKYHRKIQQYEQNYNPETGGWINPQTKDIDYGSIELEVGRTWYTLVRLLKPQNILETGVHQGYSTCCLASALFELKNNGHIWCIDPHKIKHLWENTELDAIITWLPQFSNDTLEDVKNTKFDLLVLDSNHDYNTTIWELTHFEPLLRENGHIFMHDTLYFDGVGAAVKQLYESPRFEIVTLDSPRTHGHSGRRPGITIIRKIMDGAPLIFEKEFDQWFIGKPETLPFLRNYTLEKSRSNGRN